MRRTSVIGSIVVGVLPLVATSAPASAAAAGTAAFMVTMHLPPMGYAGVFPPTTGSMTLTSTIACGTGVSGKQTTAGLCAFHAAGTITGNCGLASGTVWGTLVHYEPPPFPVHSPIVDFHVNIFISGTTFTAIGTATNGTQTGPITVVADFTPILSPPGGPSCATGNLTEFIATGNATFMIT